MYTPQHSAQYHEKEIKKDEACFAPEGFSAYYIAAGRLGFRQYRGGKNVYGRKQSGEESAKISLPCGNGLGCAVSEPG